MHTCALQCSTVLSFFRKVVKTFSQTFSIYFRIPCLRCWEGTGRNEGLDSLESIGECSGKLDLDGIFRSHRAEIKIFTLQEECVGLFSVIRSVEIAQMLGVALAQGVNDLLRCLPLSNDRQGKQGQPGQFGRLFHGGAYRQPLVLFHR